MAYRTQVSAGGVVFRKEKEAIEIAMVSVREGKVWCLPKGLIDKGEKPEATALREVAEEAGLTGRIVEKLGEISYWYYQKEEQMKCKKTVHFFLIQYESGDVANHDWEVVDAAWVPLDEAIQRASYKGEKEIIEKAKRKLAAMNAKNADIV